VSKRVVGSRVAYSRRQLVGRCILVGRRMGVFIKYILGSIVFISAMLHAEGRFAKLMLGYGSLNLLVIAVMFQLRVGDEMIGKDKRTGRIPLWSKAVFWPFNLTNYVYVYVMRWSFRRKLPDVSEILEGWAMGGMFGDPARKWKAILDLTTEFPELGRAENYLNIPVWDGNPPSIHDIQKGADFLVQNSKDGPVLCHCAFGIGRSTTLMCAALVLAGKANDYVDALVLIKQRRGIVRLNNKMRTALQQWQEHYMKTK